MATVTSQISQDGQTYFARLPGNMCISVNGNTGETVVISKDKSESLPGTPIIPYPKQGWSDPPKSVLQTIAAAFRVAVCASEKKRGKSKKSA